nr:MAG TPA: hypothetical protein [Caudoviricetes sp.]
MTIVYLVCAIISYVLRQTSFLKFLFLIFYLQAKANFSTFACIFFYLLCKQSLLFSVIVGYKS